MAISQSYRRQRPESYPQIVFLFPSRGRGVDSAVDNSGQGLRAGPWMWSRRGRYFHCVETPNPAAMKPKPTTMFQLPSGSIGSLPSVT